MLKAQNIQHLRSESQKEHLPIDIGQERLGPPTQSNLHHESEIPQSTIKCICGFVEDDGNTVLCESCDTWQHILCYYDRSELVPEDHACGDCDPRQHELDSPDATDKQLRQRGERDRHWGDRPPSFDPTGQLAPPGRLPRVSTTVWEDEHTLVHQVGAMGQDVGRREDNDMINVTKLLNVAGKSRGRRDRLLKAETTRHVVKAGPRHLRGVWLPFERALEFANKERITDMLYPLFVRDIRGLITNNSNLLRTASNVQEIPAMASTLLPTAEGTVQSLPMPLEPFAFESQQSMGQRTLHQHSVTNDRKLLAKFMPTASYNPSTTYEQPRHSPGNVQPSSSTNTAAAVNRTTPPHVPEGWKVEWDNQSNRFYFVNSFSKQYQWSTPTEPVCAPKGDQLTHNDDYISPEHRFNHGSDGAPTSIMPPSPTGAVYDEPLTQESIHIRTDATEKADILWNETMSDRFPTSPTITPLKGNIPLTQEGSNIEKAVSLTEKESEAVARLCRLGFERDLVSRAFFACDKNEELAANFLFDPPKYLDDESNTEAGSNSKGTLDHLFGEWRPHAAQLGSFELPLPPMHKYPFSKTVTAPQPTQGPPSAGGAPAIPASQHEPYSSFTQRRPHVAQLGSFELPPPPMHKYWFNPTDPRTIASVGNLLDPPSTFHSDGLNSSDVSASMPIAYSDGHYIYPPPTQAPTHYSYPHTQKVGIYNPLTQVGRTRGFCDACSRPEVKVACSKDQPKCRRCIRFDIACNYSALESTEVVDLDVFRFPHTKDTTIPDFIGHPLPFKCDLCPQSFNRNHELKRHKRMHLAVKPFPCNHCGRIYARKDTLEVSSHAAHNSIASTDKYASDISASGDVGRMTLPSLISRLSMRRVAVAVAAITATKNHNREVGIR